MIASLSNFGIDPAQFATFLMVGTFLKGASVESHNEKERIQVITNLIDGDEEALFLIDKVLASAFEYQAAAYTIQRTIQTQKFRLDRNKLDEITTNQVKLMNGRHDALIESVINANKLLFRKYGDSIPKGGVFNGDPTHVAELNPNRVAIGDWAGRLVYAYFEERRK